MYGPISKTYLAQRNELMPCGRRAEARIERQYPTMNLQARIVWRGASPRCKHSPHAMALDNPHQCTHHFPTVQMLAASASAIPARPATN